ncbi:hypothetical protein [Tropicibacter sp. R16_0]
MWVATDRLPRSVHIA